MTESFPRREDRIHLVFSLSAAALGAFALWIPSGYSIGAVGLLICSLWVLSSRGAPRLGAWQWALIGIMLAYSVIWMVDALLRGEGVRGMDQASRFIFAVPVLLAVTHVVLRWDIIWLGVGAGGYGALGMALFQVHQQGMVRASGFIGPEPFGNISTLLAGLAFLGALSLWFDKRHPVMYLTTALGGFAALGALVLSGTRAGWVALLPVLLLVMIFVWMHTNGRQRLGAVAFALMLLVTVGAFLTEPIGKRLSATYSDLTHYFDGIGTPQSVGNRFELWKGSLHLFAQKPLLGWGTNAYKVEMSKLADVGLVERSVAGHNHAHNDLVDALAKKGLIGGFVVLLIYLVPGLFFLRCLMQSSTVTYRIFCTAGLVVVITLGLYGMAHTSLANNAGVMNYAFWLALFVGSASFTTVRHHFSNQALQAA